MPDVELVYIELFLFWEHLKDKAAEIIYISCNLICNV